MQIFVVSTTLFLTAGRFGLAPTVKKRSTAGLQLYDTDNAGLITGDPAGTRRAVQPCCADAHRSHGMADHQPNAFDIVQASLQ